MISKDCAGITEQRPSWCGVNQRSVHSAATEVSADTSGASAEGEKSAPRRFGCRLGAGLGALSPWEETPQRKQEMGMAMAMGIPMAEP